MLFFLFITCFLSSSFVFFIFFNWADTPFISLFFFKDWLLSPPPSQMNNSFSTGVHLLPLVDKVKDVPTTSSASMSILDLPDLALESILERLPPDSLFRMSSLSSHLRVMCLSDHLWRYHFHRKWDSIIGPAAHTHWQSHISSSSSSTDHSPSSYSLQIHRGVGRGLLAYLSHSFMLLLLRSSTCSHIHNFNHTKRIISPPTSVVAFYQALESGKFWFPAQVFNRENGHVGFMLSCYDAELCYDSCTDTFQARYPPHGRRAVALESLITWDRLRAAPVDTSPHVLHVSDCLNDLRPKDHIEIQWRRNKEFPYGWWYGVVGHLETCDGNETYCLCHESDTVVLEFNQYTPDSRWSHTTINRKDHREEGNEADGFYGGIRKLYRNDEISMWKHFWPSEILE